MTLSPSKNWKRVGWKAVKEIKRVIENEDKK